MNIYIKKKKVKKKPLGQMWDGSEGNKNLFHLRTPLYKATENFCNYCAISVVSETNKFFHKPMRGYVKAGYKSLDPSEGNMHCDVIVLGWNDL